MANQKLLEAAQINRRTAFIWIACCAVQALPAGEKAASPIEEMFHLANYNYLMCGLFTKKALINLQLPADESQRDAAAAEYRKSIEKAKADVKTAYKKATVQIAGKREARSMLRDYYAVWLSAIDGLWPDMDESTLVYESTKQKASGDLDRLESRIRVELDIE